MELDLLVHSETVDESAIRAVGKRLIDAKSKMINAKIDAKIAVLKILSPEQRKRVKKMHFPPLNETGFNRTHGA